MKNIFENVLFAVSREDHEIEASLIKKNNYKNLLTVCSGGCVPLSLKTIYPDLNVVAYDINPNQIDHCEKKIQAVLRKDFSLLNIGENGDQSLNQLGKFEEMFQVLKHMCSTIFPFRSIDQKFSKNPNTFLCRG